MRCSSCTTELWGNPVTCPVCGAPNRLGRQSAWRMGAASPPPAKEDEPSLSAGFFNAADLLDPEPEEGFSAAPAQSSLEASDLFDPQLLDRSAEQSQPRLNAADLFDPDLFDAPPPAPKGSPERPPPAPPLFNAADLFDPDVFDAPPAARSQASLNAADLFDPELWDGDESPEDEGAGHWPEPDTGDIGGLGARGLRPDAGDGFWSTNETPPPLAPPLLSLPPLGGKQGAKRPPSAPRIPPPVERGRSFPPPLAPEEPDPMEERGWRVVSPPPTVSKSKSYPLTPASPIQPGRGARRKREQVQPSPAKGPGLLNKLAGALGLLLTLGVLGGAIFFGYMRYQHLQSVQATAASAPTVPLATVAPKPGYTIYTDKALGFSLQYLTAWQEAAVHQKDDPLYHGDNFSTDLYTRLEVGSSPQYSSFSVDQINARTITTVASVLQATNVDPSQPASPTTPLAGENWTDEDANLTLNNGVVVRLTSLAVLHNGRGYVIYYLANLSAFAAASSQFFTPMLLSFRFVTP